MTLEITDLPKVYYHYSFHVVDDFISGNKQFGEPSYLLIEHERRIFDQTENS